MAAPIDLAAAFTPRKKASFLPSWPNSIDVTAFSGGQVFGLVGIVTM